MPELPEVETTLQGIKSHVEQYQVKEMIVRQPQLRWPIPAHLSKTLSGQTVKKLLRRGKYIIFQCETGHMLLHLGMSGSVRILENPPPAAKHDHVDIVFNNGKTLRYTDPRRFGSLLWTDNQVEQHQLIKHLGPEPLSDAFAGEHLHAKAKNRKLAVKAFIMDSKVVVGVGNIYATEALFNAGIHPLKPAGKISKQKYCLLADEIKQILDAAVKKGGTTLRDFSKTDGTPGYFSQQLNVYGRAGMPCVKCETELALIKIGQRSSVFCRRCQR